MILMFRDDYWPTVHKLLYVSANIFAHFLFCFSEIHSEKYFAFLEHILYKFLSDSMLWQILPLFVS